MAQDIFQEPPEEIPQEPLREIPQETPQEPLDNSLQKNYHVAFWIIAALIIASSGYAFWTFVLNKEKGVIEEEVTELIPQKIVSAEKEKTRIVIPAAAPNIFSLKTDKETGRQSLVKRATTKEKTEEIIAFFAQPLKNAEIIMTSDASKVWIEERVNGNSDEEETSIYYIDVEKKSRALVFTTPGKILGMVPSVSGSWIAIVTTAKIYLVNMGTKEEREIPASVSAPELIAWSSGETLWYVEIEEEKTQLKRVTMESIDTSEVIQSWSENEEIIQRIYFSDVEKKILIQGKSADYSVEV